MRQSVCGADDGLRHYRDAVFVPLAFANRDFTALEVQVLDPQVKRFEQPQAAAIVAKELLDSLIDSRQNGDRLGGRLASSAETTTAIDDRLVEVSLDLLTGEVSV